MNKRGFFVRSILTLALAGMVVVPAVSLTGCKSGGLGGLMSGKSPMDMLAPALKDAANSYLQNLKSLTSSLANVRGYQDAINLVQQAEPMVKQVSSAYQTLSSASPEEKKLLGEAFGSEFKSSNSSFRSEADRVTGSWGALAKPVLDRVKLFE